MTGPAAPLPQTLLYCAPAPVAPADGGWHLDSKFVSGMARHVADWGGPVHCILWQGQSDIPFGRFYREEELPFTLQVLPPAAPLPRLHDVAGAFVSADLVQFLPLCRDLAAQNIPIVASLEINLQNRLQILWLQKDVGLARKLVRSLRLRREEREMREAFALVSGVQFNGFPAFDSYGAMVRKPHLYLDNRMHDEMMVIEAELATQADRLRAGAPLRLIQSGRLEPMKGVDLLIPLMRWLDDHAIAATLDIYGAGSLGDQIAAEIPAFEGRVRLHGPVDFERALVPVSRSSADIFLATHRQSDPSCSYLEAMGCGLAVVGSDNAMWRGLHHAAGAGSIAPMGNVAAFGQAIAAYDRDRAALIAAIAQGAAFARAHSFDSEFAGRMAHVKVAISQL